MRLRPRLVLSILLTALPLTAVMAWMRADFEKRASDRALRDLVLARMEAGGRERCEASPENFRDPPEGGGPGGPPGRRRGPGWPDDPFFDSDSKRKPFGRKPGPPPPHRPGGPEHFNFPPRFEMYAYDSSFVSRNARAPEFPANLKAELMDGAEYAGSQCDLDGTPGLQLGVRMTWQDGPCAFVLARRSEQKPSGLNREFFVTAIILTAALLAAVLVAAAPIVRRIVRLTSDVRRSAADRYTSQVEVRGKDEISQLAGAFNDAGRELRTHLGNLEKREATLRSFVANTTHDVMLPLTVLQGHLMTLRSRLEETRSELQPGSGASGSSEAELSTRQIVIDSLEEAHYMTSLIQNLGASVKLEANEERIARLPVNLNEIVERVVGRHRPIARQREINLDFVVPELPVWVEGDVTLIEQAVSNVTHNAVRYNEAGGHVSLRLEEVASAPRTFSLRVVDDGPGVSDDLLSRLSERSFRTDEARRRHPEGMGLGLHIAANVSRVHGFELKISRSEPRGLNVEICGPIRA